MAHSIAPEANIVLVLGPTNGDLNDFLNSFNVARNYPGVSVVSSSINFGTEESSNPTLYDADFTTPAGHNGVNVSFVNASGDDKDAPNYNLINTSVSPNILQVGGTTLTISRSDNYAGEQAWVDSQGGFSQTEAEPSFQYGVQQDGMRSVPDVALVAQGLDVYDTFVGTSLPTPGFYTGSGTSFAAPMWAGLVAIANEGRVLNHESTLVTLPGTLYGLPISDFHNIATGPTNADGQIPQAGYDEITGIGTPLANRVVAGLVGASQSYSASASDAAVSTAAIALNAVPGTSGANASPTTALSAAQSGLSAQIHDTNAIESSGFTATAGVSTAQSTPDQLAVIGATIASAANAQSGQATGMPVANHNAPFTENALPATLGTNAERGSGESGSAGPMLRLADNHVGFAPPVDLVDEVTVDRGQLPVPLGGSESTGDALATQAIDACFSRDGWMMEAGNPLSQRQASSTQHGVLFLSIAAVTAITSDWAVRRWKQKRGTAVLAQ